MKKFIQTEITSFKCAFAGLGELLKERHFQIHLILGVLAIVMGFIFKISHLEWIAITLAIALVLISEAINTIIEKIVDYISMERHPKAKLIKDMGAGMVLIAAIVSILIGLIVFIN